MGVQHGLVSADDRTGERTPGADGCRVPEALEGEGREQGGGIVSRHAGMLENPGCLGEEGGGEIACNDGGCVVGPAISGDLEGGPAERSGEGTGLLACTL